MKNHRKHFLVLKFLIQSKMNRRFNPSFEDVVLKTENYIHWYNTERIRIAV